MSFVKPTIQNFKEYFFRDFPYQPPDTIPPTVGFAVDSTKYVQDMDISKAMVEAGFNFNESFYSSQDNYAMCYMYLTAHFMVLDLKASSQGVAAKFTWITSSKGVGSVSESYAIPQEILNNPIFSGYALTPYGSKFLQLIYPQLMAPFMVLEGRTLP